MTDKRSLEQAAVDIGVSEKRIRTLLNEKRLVEIREGRRRYVDPASYPNVADRKPGWVKGRSRKPGEAQD